MAISFIIHILLTYVIFGILYYVIGGLTTGDWDSDWFPLPIAIGLCIAFHPVFLTDVLKVNPNGYDKAFIRVIYVLVLLIVSIIWTVL